MLESYRKLYEKAADVIPDWRTMNKNDLVNKYIDVEDQPQLANAYMSAIICRYWGALNKYYALSGNSVDKNTYYSWLIDAILYSVKHRKWKDPTNKLYTDPNAPDKVINRVIMSERDIFYQRANTGKRKQGFTDLSLESLQDDCDDSYLPARLDENDKEGSMDIQNIIQKAIKSKDYLTAFMTDVIVNYDVFSKKKDTDGKAYAVFNDRKFRKLLRSFDKKRCKIFAETYAVDVEDVEKEAEVYKNLPAFRLKRLINHHMNKLRNHYTLVRGEN